MTALSNDVVTELERRIAALEQDAQARANETAQLRHELTIARDRQRAAAEILSTIAATSGDADHALRQIAETTVRLFDASSVTLRIADGDASLGDSWSRTIAVGPGSERIVAAVAPMTLKIGGKNFPGTVVAENRQIHMPDISNVEPAFADFPDLRHARAAGTIVLSGTPLRREGNAIGALIVHRDRAEPFTEEELALQQSFADQAVIAIENARLFNETREALAQQTATAEILAVINNSGGDLAPVFECILQKAHELCGAPCGSLQLYRDDRVLPVAIRGVPAAFAKFLRRGYPFSEGVRDVLMADHPVQRLDMVEVVKAQPDEPSLRATVELGGVRTMTSVPLLRDGVVFGRIVAARQEVRPFDDKQIATLQGFAAQAVIAIENARLVQELRARTDDLSESLQQQTVTADVLKVISRSAFDLQTVLETLTQSAVNLCEAQQGIIFLRDGDLYRAEAVAGGGPDYLEFLKEHPRTPGRESICPRVALSGVVEQIPDVLEDAEYHFPGVTKISGNRALLGVPLLREGRIEGVFALGRSEPGGFTERQVELVQTFADQAVIAIENARLFNEVQSRTRELAKSLDELRAAQDRLIQTEKLASLGQLTAGIAHEIKNPLNFVNNFAALSAELTDELNEVLKPATLAPTIRDEVGELTGMLKDNLQKVVQHGKRADSIVKNMLLHSREGSGEHRPTDVNALVEESLNLAYHGARAERPQFNVALERELDPNAGTIDAFPQEITRVLLNLVSNGFYAAAKRKLEHGETGFEPVVKATTCGRPGHVEIRIRDNGTGIPPELKDKIFNPFFTTKPAGEGTGLGLSMSHDIVVKQHGGTIDVATSPGEFTEFTISLPRTADIANKTRG